MLHLINKRPNTIKFFNSISSLFNTSNHRFNIAKITKAKHLNSNKLSIHIGFNSKFIFCINSLCFGGRIIRRRKFRYTRKYNSHFTTNSRIKRFIKTIFPRFSSLVYILTVIFINNIIIIFILLFNIFFYITNIIKFFNNRSHTFSIHNLEEPTISISFYLSNKISKVTKTFIQSSINIICIKIN